MTRASERSGVIRSGDVDLFFRLFGEERTGGAPIVILHGSNYFDSEDWIDVAAALATDRPVVTFDHRGFGRSGWSEHKDYSLDAVLGDVRTSRRISAGGGRS
jgi:pimeloyl-ACP methyl ester carboxylesterase